MFLFSFSLFQFVVSVFSFYRFLSTFLFFPFFFFFYLFIYSFFFSYLFFLSASGDKNAYIKILNFLREQNDFEWRFNQYDLFSSFSFFFPFPFLFLFSFSNTKKNHIFAFHFFSHLCCFQHFSSVVFVFSSFSFFVACFFWFEYFLPKLSDCSFLFRFCETIELEYENEEFDFIEETEEHYETLVEIYEPEPLPEPVPEPKSKFSCFLFPRFTFFFFCFFPFFAWKNGDSFFCFLPSNFFFFLFSFFFFLFSCFSTLFPFLNSKRKEWKKN